MPAMSAVTLNTKVYNPRGKRGDVASWALVGDTTFGGATSVFTESVTTDTGGDYPGANRAQFRLAIPKAADAASTCACPGQEIGKALITTTAIISPGMTAAEVTDITLRAQALVAHAIWTAAMKGEGSW